MAFVIEIPTIHDDVGGNRLSLTVGGVKALNLDNLYNRKGADEHFKIFIGFNNSVCTNLCVWSDGFVKRKISQLVSTIKPTLMHFQYYNSNALLAVNPMGLIRVLYTPFRVQCVNPTNQIPMNMWVYVEEVLSTKEDELIFMVCGETYSYRNFRIEVSF